LENQTRFEYTSTYLPVNLTIHAFIPDSLKTNIYCKLSDSEVEHITYFLKSNGTSHFIVCNLTTEKDGLNNVSIWYKDSHHKFQLSSNELELVFATPRSIFSFSPPAVKQNRTSKISVSSFFTTQINYGFDNKYFCEYGYNDTGSFVISTVTSPNGVFQCDVLLLKEGKAFMKIWMQSKNILKPITSKELLNVVNSNFFEPSFATPPGGDKMQIFEYSDIISSILFVDKVLASKYSFNCLINGTTLSCTTPQISTSDIPVYSTQDIQFSNNQSISTKFILYEKRNIDFYFPKVVAATEGTFLMNITLNNQTTMPEGKLFIVLAKFTEQDKRYDLGQAMNLKQIAEPMNSLRRGVYPMQMFYFNPFSFEIRSMFSISPEVNVTFTGTSNIELVSNDDMFYINSNHSVIVKFTSIQNLFLNAIQRQSIRCKLGNEILNTNIIGDDQFSCSLSSNVRKEVSISMVYKNVDAQNQEILLSINSISITFIGIAFRFLFFQRKFPFYQFHHFLHCKALKM
jgi:hypothetical protein